MALGTFATASTAAELLGVLLAGEQRWGAEKMRRLLHAFLHDNGSRPPMRDCTIHIPGLSGGAWSEAARIKVARRLEQNWLVLRDELIMTTVEATYSPYTQGNDSFLDLNHWSTAHVKFLGRRYANADLLPKTLLVIEEAGGAAEMVSFSRIAPGGHIRPHCGPWNTRLTVHLGIQTPEGCSIRVADEWRAWSPGKCLVFDDSFEHEVVNRGREDRVVLMLDVWHPDLSRPERAVLEAMLAVLQREYWSSEAGAKARNDLGRYVVISNEEKKFALWAADRPVQTGWKCVVAPRSREDCLRWITENWNDMRSLSARIRP